MHVELCEGGHNANAIAVHIRKNEHLYPLIEEPPLTILSLEIDILFSKNLSYLPNGHSRLRSVFSNCLNGFAVFLSSLAIPQQWSSAPMNTLTIFLSENFSVKEDFFVSVFNSKLNR